MKFFLIIFFVSIPLFAKDLYIRSKKAYLYQSNTKDSKVIASLKKGELVKMIGRKRSWIKVVHNGNKGWVTKSLLTKKIPKNRSLREKKWTNGRRRLSHLTSNSDVNKVDNTEMTTLLLGNQKSLKWMERNKVPKNKGWNFLKNKDQN